MTAIVTTGEYYTNSGVLLKFGTLKAVPTTWGDYVNYGANRVIEGLVTLSTLTASSTVPSILGDVLFFPALGSGQLFIEKVEAIAEEGAASGTSFNIGLIQADRSTIPSNYDHAFINGEVTATLATAGMAQTYVQNTTHAGALIGTGAAVATAPYYITGYTSGTYTTGKIRVRIFYHAIGGITQ